MEQGLPLAGVLDPPSSPGPIIGEKCIVSVSLNSIQKSFIGMREKTKTTLKQWGGGGEGVQHFVNNQGLTLTLAHLPGASKQNVGASKGCYQVARSGKYAF